MSSLWRWSWPEAVQRRQRGERAGERAIQTGQQRLPLRGGADDFADAISARWQDSVVAIIDVGKLLLGAKHALPHGEFGRMVESDRVAFEMRTAQRLMAIAEHSLLSNTAHGSHLPSAWGTLYELTKAPEDALDGLPTGSRRRPKRTASAARRRTSNHGGKTEHCFQLVTHHMRCHWIVPSGETKNSVKSPAFLLRQWGARRGLPTTDGSEPEWMAGIAKQAKGVPF